MPLTGATFFSYLHLRRMADVRAWPEVHPLAESAEEFEEFVSEVALRLRVANMYEFDQAWEVANRVCDRYGIGRAA